MNMQGSMRKSSSLEGQTDGQRKGGEAKEKKRGSPWDLDVQIPLIAVHVLASLDTESTVALNINAANCRYTSKAKLLCMTCQDLRGCCSYQS